MLILSRKRNQSIIIAGDIRVTLLKVRGDSVQIGIDAPAHIPVHREEIHVRIQSEDASPLGGVDKSPGGDELSSPTGSKRQDAA